MKQYDSYSPFSNILKSIVILIIGAVLGSVVSLIISKSDISTVFAKSDFSYFQIVLFLVFICLVLMTYMIYETLKYIIELRHRVGIKITFIDKNNQNLYKKTTKAIEAATESILILSSAYDNIFSDEEKKCLKKERDHDEKDYFQALITSAMHRGVSYTRIMQIPDGKSYLDVFNKKGENLTDHIHELLELKQKNKNLNIGLFKAPLKSLTTFALIDESVMLWTVNEINSEGVQQMRGLFLIEYPRREITQHFKSLFDTVSNNNYGAITFKDIGINYSADQ